jgi:hypothetical protein
MDGEAIFGGGRAQGRREWARGQEKRAAALGACGDGRGGGRAPLRVEEVRDASGLGLTFYRAGWGLRWQGKVVELSELCWWHKW